jgi:hypothetical protein
LGIGGNEENGTIGTWKLGKMENRKPRRRTQKPSLICREHLSTLGGGREGGGNFESVKE